MARVFLQNSCKQLGKQFNGFTDDAVNALLQYRWPGNVRELQNKVKSAAIMSDGKQISEKDLALNMDMTGQEDALCFNLKQVREAAEKQAVKRALSISNGNISNTASLLGITRPTLYTLIEKYSLQNK